MLLYPSVLIICLATFLCSMLESLHLGPVEGLLTTDVPGQAVLVLGHDPGGNVLPVPLSVARPGHLEVEQGQVRVSHGRSG